MSTSSSSVGLAQLLGGLALLVAGGHVAYAVTSAPPSPPPAPSPASTHPAASECRCDDAALRSELADLRRALREVEQASVPTPVPLSAPTHLEPLSPRSVARTPPSEQELAVAMPATTPLPPIALFIDIPSGVKLSQRADGTVEAKATQPERVGEELLVHALVEGGEMKIIKARVE